MPDLLQAENLKFNIQHNEIFFKETKRMEQSNH